MAVVDPSEQTLDDRPVADALLVSTHDVCWLHDTGPNHPESALRLTAVRDGLLASGLDDGLVWVEAPPVERATVERVHDPFLYDRLQQLTAVGGGAIDPDTMVSADSAEAAARAAGAGIDLIDRLDRGEGRVGWSVVRPPGHHATPNRQMGFCLFNNVAVAARHLADRGERVLIVDIDAHHGNGTQDVFFGDPNVLFVSFHQYPWYPGTGKPTEVGEGDGLGTTVNVALPAHTTGETYRFALDTVVAPVVERFGPTWVLISAGFDGHRSDPITELGLTSGDYADLVAEILGYAPIGRRLMFLEGGYDLRALADCAGSVAAAALGEQYRPEQSSSGGPGADEVELARRIHVDQAYRDR